MPIINLETVTQGIKCKATGAESLAIQTYVEWKKLLDTMYGRESKYLRDEFDFRKTTIVAVLMGTSIPGSSVDIVGAYTKRNGVYVKVERNTVLGGNSVLNTYSPYHLVCLEKCNRTFRFEYTDPLLDSKKR